MKQIEVILKFVGDFEDEDSSNSSYNLAVIFCSPLHTSCLQMTDVCIRSLLHSNISSFIWNLLKCDCKSTTSTM